MSRLARRPLAWFGGGVLLALLLVGILLLGVTRSSWGQARILDYTLNLIGGRLSGVLEAERLSGDLLTGARLFDVALRDDDGEPLLLADSLYINYELPTFLGGDVVINRLVVYSPELLLYRLPGDTLWNYQRVLTDPSPAPDTAAAGGATLISEAVFVDAQVAVQLPWEPEAEQEGPERRREIRQALQGETRLRVEEVEDGYLRTMRFEVDEGELSDLIIAPDERGGTYLRVERLQALAWLYDEPPLALVDARGELSLQDGILRLEAPEVRLPASSASIAGQIDLTGDEPAYDLVMEADRVALQDLQWLYPRLPDEGAAELTLVWETRPEGTLFLAQDLLLVTPDTRLAGDVGVVLGDTLRIVESDLEADPLGERFVDRILPEGLPVEGLRIESAALESPPNAS